MKNEKDNDVAVLKEFLACDLGSSEAVFEKFKGLGGELYKGDGKGERFFWKQGMREDRITLVAHADTVFKGKPQIESEIVDGQEILKSAKPEIGIGADCRAGCAILRLLADSGHNILITDGEEEENRDFDNFAKTGKLVSGAGYLMEHHKAIRNEINNSGFVMNFDGPEGFALYGCEGAATDEFLGYMEQKTGFTHKRTTKGSDVKALCADVCGVNIGVGYYRQHKPSETLNVDEWMKALNISRELAFERMPRFSIERQNMNEQGADKT